MRPIINMPEDRAMAIGNKHAQKFREDRECGSRDMLEMLTTSGSVVYSMQSVLHIYTVIHN